MAKRLQRQVDFDQNAQIIRYFKIKYLPVSIIQENNNYVIQAFAIGYHTTWLETTT